MGGDAMVVRRLSLALIACLAGVVGGCALPPVQAGPQVSVEVPTAVADLELAMAAAPYPLRVATLPDRFELARVDWMDEPDDPVRHGFSIGMRYFDRDGVMVHTFQTNVSAAMMGETDPVTLPDGETVVIAGAEWTAVTLANGDGTFNTQIARRFSGTAVDELITLSIDAPTMDLVTLVAESLVEVPSTSTR